MFGWRTTTTPRPRGSTAPSSRGAPQLPSGVRDRAHRRQRGAGTALIESIVTNQGLSVGLSLLISLLALGLTSGRWGPTLKCIAANVWALLLVLGAAGWLGVEMGVATSSFLALGVGVGLDYGIHLAFDKESVEGGPGAVSPRVECGGGGSGPGRAHALCQSHGGEAGLPDRAEPRGLGLHGDRGVRAGAGGPLLPDSAGRRGRGQSGRGGLTGHTGSGIIHIPPLARSEVPTLGTTYQPGARRGR